MKPNTNTCKFRVSQPETRQKSLTTVACQFGRYRSERLTLKSGISRQHVSVRNDMTFKDVHNVFSTADDNLIVDYDAEGRDRKRKFSESCK